MKRFNKVISIEVSIDSIADKLLSVFPDDYKHKDILTEAIIAPAVEKGTIGYIYNALNGYTSGIDFTAGEYIITTERIYDYKTDPKSDEYREIGLARIKEVNEYRDDKLLVEYYKYNRDGSQKLDSKWISHKTATKQANCDGFPEEMVVAAAIPQDEYVAR